MQELDQVYSYSKLPESDLDKLVLDMQFKHLLEKIDETNQEQLEFNFLLKYCIYLADNLDSEIEEKLSLLKKNILKKMSTENIFRVFFSLQGLFLKEVYLGPSNTHHDIDSRKKQEKREKQMKKIVRKFPFYNFQPLIKEMGIEFTESELFMLGSDLKNLNLYNYKFVKQKKFILRKEQAYLDHLEQDGEQWARLMPYTAIFILAKFLVEFLHTQKGHASPFFSLWAGRVHYLHNNILFTPTGTIKQKVFGCYDQFFKEIFGQNVQKYNFISKKQHALFCIEHSNVLLFFYSYNRSTARLMEAQKLMGVGYSFTGKIGVRTKYQTFKIAQLVVEVQNDDEKKEVEYENQSTLNPYEILQPDENILRNQQFDEESILYETPKLEEEKDTTSALNLYDQIIVLGIIRNLEVTNPHDELYQEQIQAYCNILVDKSHNWLVFTNSLFIRSINEFEKFKRMERALLQLQTLIDQFNDAKPSSLERSLYVYPLSFPSQLELYKIVASKYMKVGMVRTACDLYEKLEMYEELVEGMAMGGQRERAKEIAQKHLEIYPKSPKMLCILGDLTRDFQYYKKAWKISGKKFARAQRELGRVYFYQGKFQKSIKAFQKATAINCLVLEPFFTMGCAYMKLEDYQGAISAFSSCVSIDNTASDAWANMANAFLAQGKKQQAFTTLEQAVKHNEKSWRMWNNLLQVSLFNKKFYKYFECIQRLVQLEKGLETIDDKILIDLNKIFAYNISIYPKTPYKSPFNTMRLRIERLYVLMCEKIGQNYLVWQNFADYYDLVQEFFRLEMHHTIEQAKKDEEKAKNEPQEQQQQNQLTDSSKPAIKTEGQIRAQYADKFTKLKQKVFDLRQSAVNVCMVSGWDTSKLICEKLVVLIEEYLIANKDAERGEEGRIEMERFIKTVTGPMNRNLEKNVNFQI